MATNADFAALQDTPEATTAPTKIKATNADFKALLEEGEPAKASAAQATNADFKALSTEELKADVPKMDTREHNPAEDLKNTIQSGGKALQGYVSNLKEETAKHPLEALDAFGSSGLHEATKMLDIPGNLIKGAWRAVSPKTFAAAQKVAPGLIQMNALANRFGIKGPQDATIAANEQMNPTMAATGGAMGPFAMPLYDMVKAGGMIGKVASKIPIAGAIPRVGNNILAASPLVQRAVKASIGAAPLATTLATNEALTNPNNHQNMPAQIIAGAGINMLGAGAVQPVADVAEHYLTRLFGTAAAKQLKGEIAKNSPIPDRPEAPLAPQPEASKKEALEQFMSGETVNSAIIPRAVRKAPVTYKNARVSFENPVDKALWLSTTRNKTGDAALLWLQKNTHYTPQEIHEAGQAVRAGVAAMHKNNPAQFELRVEKNAAQSEHQTQKAQKAQEIENKKRSKEDKKVEAERAKLDAREQKDREKFKKDYERQLEKLKKEFAAKRLKDAKAEEKEKKDFNKAYDKANESKAKEDADLKRAEAKAWEYAENQNRRAHAKSVHEKAKLEAQQAKLDERKKILEGKVTKTVEAKSHIPLEDIEWGIRQARLDFLEQLPKADLGALSPKHKGWITELGNAKNKENAAHARYLAWNQALLDIIGKEPKMRAELKGSVRKILLAKHPKLQFQKYENSLEITAKDSYQLTPEERAFIDKVKNRKQTGGTPTEVFLARNIMEAKGKWEQARTDYQDLKDIIVDKKTKLTRQDVLKGLIEEGHQLTWNDFNVYHKSGNNVPIEGKTAASKAAYRAWIADKKRAMQDASNLTTAYIVPEQHGSTKRAVDDLRNQAGKLGDKELKDKWLKVAAAFEDKDAIKLLQNRGVLYSVPLAPDIGTLAQVAKSLGKFIPDKHTIFMLHLTVQHMDTYEKYARLVHEYLKDWGGQVERASAGVEMPKTSAENMAYYKALKANSDEYDLEKGIGDFEALKGNEKLRDFLIKLKSYRAELKETLTDYLHFAFPGAEEGEVLPPTNQLFGPGLLYPTLMNDLEGLSGRFDGSPAEQAALRNLYASYSTGNFSFHTAHAIGGILGNVSQEPLLFLRLGELKQKRGQELEDYLSHFKKGGQYASLSQEAVEKNDAQKAMEAWKEKVLGDKLDWLSQVIPEDKLQAALSIARGENVELWKMDMARATGLIQAADHLKMRPDQLLDLLIADLKKPTGDPRVAEAYAEIAAYMNSTVGYNVPGYNNVGILAHMPWAKPMFAFTGSKQIEAHLTQTFLGNAANAIKAGDIKTASKEAGKFITFTALSVALNGSKGLSRETVMAMSVLSPALATELNDQLNKFAFVGNMLDWHPTHVQVTSNPYASSAPGGFVSTWVKDQAKLNITHDEKETSDPGLQQARVVALSRAGAFLTAVAGLEEWLHLPIGLQVCITLANHAYDLIQGHKTDMGHAPSTAFGVVGGDREFRMNNMITDGKDFVKRTFAGGEGNEEFNRKSEADLEEAARWREKLLAPKQYLLDLKRAQAVDNAILSQLNGAKSPIYPLRLLGGIDEKGEPILTREHFSWVDSCNRAVPDPLNDAVHSIFKQFE